MKKKIFILLFFVLLVFIVMYLYIYKQHRNITDEVSAYNVTVEIFEKDFKENDSLANVKYLDKTIEINGKITSLEEENKSIIIDEKVYATFSENFPKGLTKGKNINVKGRFVGYDDLLEQFKLDQITIEN